MCGVGDAAGKYGDNSVPALPRLRLRAARARARVRARARARARVRARVRARARVLVRDSGPRRGRLGPDW